MFNGQNFHAGPDGADTGVATVHLLKGQVGKLIVPAQAGMDVAVFGDDAIGHIRLGVKGPNNVGGEAVEARVGVDERIYGALSRHRAPEHGQHPAGRVHVRVGRARMDDGEEQSHVSHIMDNNLIIAGPQGVSTVVTIPLQTLRGLFGCPASPRYKRGKSVRGNRTHPPDFPALAGKLMGVATLCGVRLEVQGICEGFPGFELR